MAQGIRQVVDSDVQAALSATLTPYLSDLLTSRGAGHCMKVLDLDRALMLRLAKALRQEVPDSHVYVLREDSTDKRDAHSVSSTKIVELRNPLPDGSLRSPILIFVPNESRTAAEDSFGVATFEQIDVSHAYERLKADLLEALSESVRGYAQEVLRAQSDWTYARPMNAVRFLLTLKLNGGDKDVLGAALYELGLVPDFELVEASHLQTRLHRNIECMRKLTLSGKSERTRVLELELSDRAFRSKLSAFFASTGLEDPFEWTKQIVTDRVNWSLSFDKWAFEDGGTPETLLVEVTDLDLPTVSGEGQDERIHSLVGQKYLPIGKGGLNKLSVTFRTDPLPSRVQGLNKFLIRVVSRDHGPTGITQSKKAWKTSRSSAKVTFSKLKQGDWEEGWYYVQVQALTGDGMSLPLIDQNGQVLPIPEHDNEEFLPQAPNESDLFYVVPEGELEEPPPKRSVPEWKSLTHAQLGLRLNALQEGRSSADISLKSLSWARNKGSNIDTLEVVFAREGAVQVPVSPVLKRLEQAMLDAANQIASWQLRVHRNQVSEPTPKFTQSEAAATQVFIQARSRYFEAVKGEGGLISQAADFARLQQLAADYAHSYHEAVRSLQHFTATSAGSEKEYLAELQALLHIDTVHLTLVDFRGGQRAAALISPLHPLRALWLATWTKLSHSWLSQTADRDLLLDLKEALFDRLSPSHYPFVLPVEGRLYTHVDNLDTFWGLYAAADEQNPRGLLGDVCAALKVPEPVSSYGGANANYLSERVQRYLWQHPYVQTLTLNVFNPGRARLLAATLLTLQKNEAFASLTYNIRLFVPDPEAVGVGDALKELLSPTSNAATGEADAFSTPSGNHLFPKLRLSILQADEFRRSPSQYRAHLSLLFDVFPEAQVGVAEAKDEVAAPVHGLVQDIEVSYTDSEALVAWKRQPRHGQAQPIDEGDHLSELLASLAMTLSSATSTLATGQTGVERRPQITLALKSNDRALLHQVHEFSDWVISIDRNIGIEFFDHGGRRERPEYLIDHVPEVAAQSRHYIVTSRSLTELEAMLGPVLADYGLGASKTHTVAILNQLKSLSGRLALKLLSASTQRAEALGLALARIYLEYQGVFANQVVVPLDAHLDLYTAMRRSTGESGDIGFERTDLALFDLDAQRRTITCNLVEVKCYKQVGGLASFNQLKATIASQVNRSEQVLRHHFGVDAASPRRPDYLLRTRELAKLLEFYLNRAVRYNLFDERAQREAKFLLQSLERGYSLTFTRSAIIFDFEKLGTDPPEQEGNVEYHRIGRDLVQELLEVVASKTKVLVGRLETHDTSETFESDRTQSIPRLGNAAFIAKTRDRSVSWESLRTDDTLGREKSEPASSQLPTESDLKQSSAPPDESLALSDLDENREETSGTTTESEMSQSEPLEAEQVDDASQVSYDILLGTDQDSPQYGLLGEVSGRKVALDLNQTHTISLFGVQGGGKSYTLGTIAEMAALPIPSINVLPRPLATVIFHYSQTQEYKPEFTTMNSPNAEETQLKALQERYGAQPKALNDIVLLVPEGKTVERRREYPDIDVRPLKFGTRELQAGHWRFLMGAVGNQATYMRQINMIMRQNRNDLSIGALHSGIEESGLQDHLKAIANMRLNLAAQYIEDDTSLTEAIRPGRMVIVDIRDEFIEKDEALGLFIVVLQMFADAKHDGNSFNKLVIFDEAHKYIESPDLTAGLIEVVREMRHKGTSIMVASQDPPSVPVALIELSSQVVLHKFNSPQWLKHIQKANAALRDLTPEDMTHLNPGEAYVWSSKATDDAFSRSAIKVRCRPRVTSHGGATKTAVDDSPSE